MRHPETGQFCVIYFSQSAAKDALSKPEEKAV